MKVSLQQVNKNNYETVCELDASNDQEEFVACNMWSLVEANFNEGYETRAIYLNDTPVGFFMWVREKTNKVAIWRFMIDEKHQKKGIGRKALGLALDEIKKLKTLKKIEICYNPKNPVAKQFYSSFGFVEVGLDEAGEDMLAIIEMQNHQMVPSDITFDIAVELHATRAGKIKLGAIYMQTKILFNLLYCPIF